MYRQREKSDLNRKISREVQYDIALDCLTI